MQPGPTEIGYCAHTRRRRGGAFRGRSWRRCRHPHGGVAVELSDTARKRPLLSNEVRVRGHTEALGSLRQVVEWAGDDSSEVALH